jgi:hypothetical protein
MLALATLVKFYPALLLPLFLRTNEEESNKIEDEATIQQTGEKSDKQSIRSLIVETQKRLRTLTNRANIKLLLAFALTIVLAYLPYLSVGFAPFVSLSNEFNEEGFTGKGSRYFLLLVIRHLLPVPTLLFLFIALLALSALGLWWLTKPKPNAVVVARGAMALIGLYFFISTPRYHWYYAWILPFVCFAPRISWLYLTGATVLLYCVWFTPYIYPDIPLWVGAAIFVPTFVFLLWENRRRQGKQAQQISYQYRLSKEM